MLKRLVLVILSLFVATAALAQGASYKIQSGDQLSIEVLEDPSLNRTILVLPDGNITFPLAGTIKARGMTVGQLTSSITKGLAPNFAATPTVYVAVQSVTRSAGGPSRKTIEVYLIGEVVKPGVQEVPAGTTVLQFLAQSGGFTKFAAKKRLQLRRTSADGTQHVFAINYRNIELGKDVKIGATVLQNGDVIVVPERRLFE